MKKGEVGTDQKSTWEGGEKMEEEGRRLGIWEVW